MTLVEALIVGSLILVILGLAFLLWRQAGSRAAEADWTALAAQLQQSNERLERELRDELSRSAAATRQEMQHSLTRFQQALTQSLQSNNHSQNLQALAAREAQDAAAQRQTQALNESLRVLAQTVEQRLGLIQQGNEAKLEQMRATVDEKLHATLEQRLGESFKQVAERLEQVHQGLGEMQGLARDVGSLSRVLSNVKTRGVFGEVQLQSLLEQVFTAEQYATHVATVPGSAERVEFALKLPGQRTDGVPLWLPIDAKFPREDYERLLEAQDRADAPAAEAAAKALEARLRQEAKTIRDKYLAPPHTTDFAMLFLPTEGLYAEALRRPGLLEALQREHKVMVVGPTTLLATLSSLQMGFRTLALEKRSAEVWEVLGAVKTEFGKFAEVLAKTKKKLDEASASIDAAETRSRVMTRKLKGVEALPEPAAQDLLQLASPGGARAIESGEDGLDEAHTPRGGSPL